MTDATIKSRQAARRKARRAAERGRRTLSGQARTVLALVVVFTAAFVAVIGMKISSEWRAATLEGELDQVRAAAYLAERAGARISAARAATEALAGAVAVDAGGDVDAHLESLAARRDVLAAGLFDADGAQLGTSTADSGGEAMADALSNALEERDGRSVWVVRTPAGGPQVFVAADIAAADGSNRRERTVVARLAEHTLAPAVVGGRIFALTDDAGVVIASSGAESPLEPGEDAARGMGSDPVAALELAEARGGALAADPADDGSARVTGVAPVSDTGLAVYVAGPLLIDRGEWRRTLIFYILLLAAPLLVAVGLCAVLLMQLDNVRQAREALDESEKRLNLAIESARCGVWDWDVSDDTVFMTASLARMLGHRIHARVSSNEFLSLIRREDQERVRQAMRGAAGAGEVDVEFRANGLPVWLHARGRPWTGADNRPSSRIVGVAIDVTEQKGAQARVAAAETRLRAALESMGESFALWDARRRLVLSNRKFRDFFHLDAKLVRPGAAYEMLELAAQGAIKTVEEIPDEGEASELELSDGRWVQLSERRTADGGMVSIGTDITALKRQEGQLIENERRLRRTVTDLRKARESLAEAARSLEQEKIRAEEANRSKSEFLANMSHELRTPLNAINGFSEIMTQQMFGPLGDARYADYANDILVSGRHLLDLINDILDMSKIEAGKMKLSLEPVMPDELAQQCARLVRGKAKEADLDLVVSVSDLPAIHADPRALKQIIINLLSNAVKFTPPGGRIELRGDLRPGAVAFQVSDNGIGISHADLERLGKPFEQIENQQSKRHQGSGLGLALSKSLVEMHGGELVIESELGFGTSVTFTVPHGVAALGHDDEADFDDELEDDADLGAPASA